MTEFFKELNIIDIPGIGVPGCLQANCKNSPENHICMIAGEKEVPQ